MTTEATIRKHAHACLVERCSVLQMAVKALRWQYDPKGHCVGHPAPVKGCKACGEFQRRPRSVAVDIYEAFDAVGVPLGGGPQLCVQWTSYSNTAARIRKVEATFLNPTGAQKLRAADRMELYGAIYDVRVWGYVDRSGFREWRFDWGLWVWHAQAHIVREAKPEPDDVAQLSLADLRSARPGFRS